MSKKKWIQDINLKKGALKKQLHIKKGEKIPIKKLNKAIKAGGVEAKRANLAKTFRSFKK